MKTTTLLLVTFVLSLTLSTVQSQTVIPIAIEIPLAKAIKDPAFVQAMYLQLDDGFLHGESNIIKYAATVIYNTLEFKVIGTYEEWVSFFLMDLTIIKVDPLPTKLN